MKPTSKNAPMAAAPLVFNEQGEVQWDQMWDSFCLLAKEGGPPHRGDLLQGRGLVNNDVTSKQYLYAAAQIIRALQMLTPYNIVDKRDGWVEVQLKSKNQARWFAEIIRLENVECKVAGKTILLPVHDDFVLEKEIKNVVTVVAKAQHYWENHRSGFTKFIIHIFGKDIQDFEYEE
jgi:sirohydrochlorin cobaltochelatase